MSQALLIGLLAVITVAVVWYVIAVLLHAWLIATAAGGGAPTYRTVSRLAPAAAAEAEKFWASYPRKAGERVEALFRRGWWLSILLTAAFLALPVLILAAAWVAVLSWHP